ncbi:ABC transporter ATP-binding protein, partial [bacterium]|nr:ABC transporter ATP-binding protein [bacterium]
KKHLDKVVSQCSLESVKNKLSCHLSKGYRQRLGLAQALIGDPDVLILDEPTTGLDPKQIIEIRELIRELGGEKTIILSSHVLPEVSQLCKRVIILNEGQLIAVDTPQNLNRNLHGSDIILLEISGRNKPDNLISILNSIPELEQIKLIESSSNNTHKFSISTDNKLDIRPLIAKTVVETDWNLLELKLEPKSLEDIFIKLVTSEEVNQ